MTLTARDVAEIQKILEESAFDELDLELNGMKLSLRRAGAAPAATRPVAPVSAAMDAPVNAVVAPGSLAPAVVADPSLDAVKAPLLGTFYRAPKPGAPPFVEVGANVTPDSIVGIIEVMKLMNTVRAGTGGVVRGIIARDGALVEYGETLLCVGPV